MLELMRWNVARIIKLLLGIIMLFLAFFQKENLLYIFGGILISQAIFNTCNDGNCKLN